MTQPIFVDATAVFDRCSPVHAADAIEQALLAGLDPARDTARTRVDLEHGQLLLMPSGAGERFSTPGIDHVGVKVATVTPANPAIGLPRIQASYLLFDAATLSLRAVLDGTALTTLRTPAVSLTAIRHVLHRRGGPLSVAVIGSGPQALGHAAALEASVQTGAVDVRFLVRDPGRAAAALGPSRAAVQLGTRPADQLLRSADVVVCATSARVPVLDGAALADHVVVVAVGSHEPHAREVDGALCRRATVVVEDVATARREAGDVVLAIDEGALDADRLVSLRDLVMGDVDAPDDRPLLFKSVGMPWEDLVVADAVLRGYTVST